MTPAEEFAAKRLEAEALIRQHAPERLQSQLIALLRPAIALTATRTGDAQIPIGASKFGGAPDVPSDFVWPVDERPVQALAPPGGPMMFICQWNLAELASWDEENRLPETGWLSFFADLWSYEHKLFFFDNVDKRIPDSTTQSDNKPLCCRMEFDALWTLPGYWSAWQRYLPDFEWSEHNSYSMAFEQLYEVCSESGAHMFGYQHPYHDECWPDDGPYELFCQFGGPKAVWPEEEIGVGIGFLVISKKDLARRNFSNTWFEIQGM